MALAANLLLVLLSLVMGLRLIRQYSVRRRSHTLWYAVGLLLLAAAAFPEVYYRITDQLPTPLWWLYWMTASATVGFLGVGTGYLVSPLFGRITLAITLVLTAAVAVATVVTGGPAPEVVTDAALTRAPSAAIKLPFVLQNAIGSLVIFGGAIWSYLRTRGLYALWIALGTLVFAGGGAAAGLLKFPGAFYFTQSAGILLLYAGVTQSGGSRKSHTDQTVG
jgi:hypothetical protein